MFLVARIWRRNWWHLLSKMCLETWATPKISGYTWDFKRYLRSLQMAPFQATAIVVGYWNFVCGPCVTWRINLPNSISWIYGHILPLPNVLFIRYHSRLPSCLTYLLLEDFLPKFLDPFRGFKQKHRETKKALQLWVDLLQLLPVVIYGSILWLKKHNSWQNDFRSFV